MPATGTRRVEMSYIGGMRHDMTRNDITGLILAGGRGSRMGGVDKGLQNFNGMPLALHTLMRLQTQVGNVMINANRNLAAYESFGAPVWPDALADYAGPLAGFLTGLERCETPYLLTVPCDTPLFPLDLVQRLADALDARGRRHRHGRGARKEDGPGQSRAPSRCFACCASNCWKAWCDSPTAAAARSTPGRRSTRPPSCHLTSRVTTRARSSTPTRWPSCTRSKAVERWRRRA